MTPDPTILRIIFHHLALPLSHSLASLTHACLLVDSFSRTLAKPFVKHSCTDEFKSLTVRRCRLTHIGLTPRVETEWFQLLETAFLSSHWFETSTSPT